jgi:hypothetical protein
MTNTTDIEAEIVKLRERQQRLVARREEARGKVDRLDADRRQLLLTGDADLDDAALAAIDAEIVKAGNLARGYDDAVTEIVGQIAARQQEIAGEIDRREREAQAVRAETAAAVIDSNLGNVRAHLVFLLESLGGGLGGWAVEQALMGVTAARASLGAVAELVEGLREQAATLRAGPAPQPQAQVVPMPVGRPGGKYRGPTFSTDPAEMGASSHPAAKLNIAG